VKLLQYTLDRRSILLGLPALLSTRLAQADEKADLLDRTRLSLTFNDDFNHFDRYQNKHGTWRTVFGSGGPLSIDNRSLKGNAEKQVYMDPEFGGSDGGTPIGINPFSIRDGKLRIEAKPTPPEILPRVWGLPYTSGLITSKFSFTQTYGYFEMRAKLPPGKGLWPAFWLLPVKQGWPPEIDIMEVLGKDSHKLYTTVIQKKFVNGSRVTQKATVVDDMSAGFHTYGASWQPDAIRWYFDDRQVAMAPTPAELNTPMYMLANLAVGGRWGGDPDGSTHFPAVMEIDFIRAYTQHG
jgi:beta-glucanase (GH16 family)